jgi:hypothetical protein
MDTERGGRGLRGSMLFKKDEEVLFYVKGHSCDAYATIHFHSARRLGRMGAWKLLEDEFAWVVLATELTLSRDKYAGGKLIGRSPCIIDGEDLTSRPGKVAPAKLLLAKGFKLLEKGYGSRKLVECCVPQLDAISQDDVVADEGVEPLGDLGIHWFRNIIYDVGGGKNTCLHWRRSWTRRNERMVTISSAGSAGAGLYGFAA